MTPTTSAPMRMHDDHAAARAHLDRLAEAVRGGAGTAAARAELDWFAAEFAAHMDREDRSALPLMERVMGEWCSLPAWMRREHAEIKRKLADVCAALDAAGGGGPGAASALGAQAAQFDAMVRSHLHREDTWLLPVAAAVLNAGQWAAIEEGWT